MDVWFDSGLPIALSSTISPVLPGRLTCTLKAATSIVAGSSLPF